MVIEVTDIKNDTTTSYDSMCEAARALDIRWTVMNNSFSKNQKKPYKGQYTFKKKTKTKTKNNIYCSIW